MCSQSHQTNTGLASGQQPPPPRLSRKTERSTEDTRPFEPSTQQSELPQKNRRNPHRAWTDQTITRAPHRDAVATAAPARIGSSVLSRSVSAPAKASASSASGSPPIQGSNLPPSASATAWVTATESGSCSPIVVTSKYFARRERPTTGSPMQGSHSIDAGTFRASTATASLSSGSRSQSIRANVQSAIPA